MKKYVLLLAAASMLYPAENSSRPKITGLAHIAVYAKDPAKSRDYYREFLGFEQPYKPDAGGAWIYKINDRQYVHVFPERERGTDRLHHIAIEVEDAGKMRSYLASRNVRVPAKVTEDTFGDLMFDFQDPEGHTVRVVQYRPGGRLTKDKGKNLPDGRISKRMMHVGIIVTRLDPVMRFYREVLGFQEFWRGSSNGTQLSWINLKVPDGEDYIELMLYKEAPPQTQRGGAHHLCLEVPSVPEAAATLEARPWRKQYSRTIEPRVGRNRKRQVNLFDPDGTRAELMEWRTIDGAPAEPSQAPPP